MEPELTDIEKAEKLKEYRKKYREEHKDKLKEYNAKYKEEHRGGALEYNKKYYESKKDDFIQNGKTKIVCECGMEVEKWHMSRHKKTKKHLNILFPPPKIDTPIKESIPKQSKCKRQKSFEITNITDNTISINGPKHDLLKFINLVRHLNPDCEIEYS